jgi:assimilatory nitrate reductase catalytic subunit
MSKAPHGTHRLFGERRFYTPNEHARLVPLDARSPAYRADDDFPVTLMTGRERDHWHTLNRSGKSPRLALRAPEPVLALNPGDARRFQLEDGSIVKVESRWGFMLARLRVTDEQTPNTAFLPMHWNDHFAAMGRVNALAPPAVDPLSGQPEFKSIPVRLVRMSRDWEAIALLRSRPATVDAPYWALAAGVGHWRVFAAGDGSIETARDRLSGQMPNRATVTFCDPAAQRFRLATIVDGALDAWLDIRPISAPPQIDIEWIGTLFQKENLSHDDRRALLAGRSGAKRVDDGPIICACYCVGRAKICRAIQERQLTDLREIGAALAAGTGCGSCIPELRALLAKVPLEAT